MAPNQHTINNQQTEDKIWRHLSGHIFNRIRYSFCLADIADILFNQPSSNLNSVRQVHDTIATAFDPEDE